MLTVRSLRRFDHSHAIINEAYDDRHDPKKWILWQWFLAVGLETRSDRPWFRLAGWQSTHFLMHDRVSE
jgi:hypothetical protein